MKKKLFVILFLLLFTGLTIPQIIPVDEKTVKVTARGYGNNEDETKKVAFENGLDMLISDMITMTEERMKYQQNQNSIMKNVEKYVIKYSIKKKFKADGEYRGKDYDLIMTIEMLMNKESLRKDLETMGIIKSSKDLRSQLDNFSIMPIIDKEDSSELFINNKEIAYAKIASYLQNQHIPVIGEEEIKRVQENEEIINLTKSRELESGEEDVILQLARNTHADFYIKVAGKVEKAYKEGFSAFKVNISISSYTVMTGEHIASQTGYSQPYTLSSKDASISAGIEEAVNSTMDDIMNKLRLFWKDYVADGRPYKLVFYDYSFGELAKIRRTLKEMTNRVKLDKKAGNVASFLVWYDGQVDDLLFEIPARMDLNLNEEPAILGNTIRFFNKKS
ncbi:MAG: hypothetical protein FXF47_02180 [Candidatus Mcinerneyibacterium aminivorans]|uniref:Uncharacterized protein n=1 Tax=Candidatus Mcinerneyibacterium aminivorans TaxID=2703815 RepID=A0A5D0MKS4_9BACT|nr:MAG: hypothetical protein FXF47_02180 [Candidatus Mcinerneyibacterium aminivorans]